MTHDQGLLQMVLDCPMGPNDAQAGTVRDYFVELAAAVWREGEGFSGKRPFGNSGWESQVYKALDARGLTTDDESYAERERLVLAAIRALR